MSGNIKNDFDAIHGRYNYYDHTNLNYNQSELQCDK